jgi:hypothetical protein
MYKRETYNLELVKVHLYLHIYVQYVLSCEYLKAVNGVESVGNGTT